MIDQQIANHRTRVAAQKRERTRAHLVETAMLVFAEKGVGASVIQEVIATAEVSQGTFYNYFRTNEDLLVAVSGELNNELLGLIESEVGGLTDPAKRIAAGLRLYLNAARDYPLFARFVVSAGLHAAGPNNLIYEYLPPHIEGGMASARFYAMSTEAALDLIAGAALAAVVRIAAGEVPPDYAQEVVTAILRGLGVSPAQAAKLASPDPASINVPAKSLLARSHARSAALGTQAEFPESHSG